ncbi:MAG TPA: MFS transporter [Candidatus Limnocylindrales bacterium]
MYLSTVDRPRQRLKGAVAANVLALGTVSLITDVSSEMVTAILPVYLVVGLQLSPAAYGVIDGVYTGSTVLLRLAGGYAADRIRRRKAVAAAGYGLSAAAKLGLIAAAGSTTGIGVAIAVDRAGKGLRTAPRDALITLSTPPHRLGRAFGVHRMMDSIGAFAGPLVALAVLSVAGSRSYDAVFVTSFCVAAFGLVVLLLFVRDHANRLAPRSEPVSPRIAAGLLREPAVRRLTGVACLLGLATIGDGFVYLLLQRKAGLSLGWFPLLAVGTSLAYLLLALPIGRLSDRIGRHRVLLIGFLALIIGYGVLLAPIPSTVLIVVVPLSLGLFYAATDGVLMALAGPVLPARLRTTGLALLQTGQAVAYLGSSVLFGLAWQSWGAGDAVAIAVAGTLAAGLAAAFLLRRGVPGPEVVS